MINAVFSLRDARAGMPRMKHAAAIILALIYAAVFAAAGASGSVPVRLALAAVSTALLSALFFMYRRPAVYALPVIAAAVVFVMTRSVTFALSELIIPLPAAILISALLSLGADKARAVTAASASFAVSAALLLLVFRLTGGRIPGFAEIESSLSDFFASMTSSSRNGPVPVFTEDAASALASHIRHDI